MMDARNITLKMHGTWHRSYGTAPCPICQTEGRKDQNALTLKDGHLGRLLLHCKKSGCSFTDILAAAGIMAGDYTPPDPTEVARREAVARTEAEKKERQALAIWREAQPIRDTIAEAYLRGRGIACDLPESLRFHPTCWHPSAQRLPAMVAQVDGAERFAVHRTYLHEDGRGRACVMPVKAMLGSVSGGAVRLSGGSGPIVVAEGIETGLSLLCGLLSGPVTVWAALSTSGLCSLRLPDPPSKLVVATDGDAPGRETGLALAGRAFALGWTVSTLPASDGRDWNDVLQLKGGAA